MANVLPADKQKRVWTMYRARFVLVTSLMLFGLAAAAGLTLFPSYVALEIAAPSVAEVVEGAGADRESVVSLERSQVLIRELGPLLSSTSSPIAAVESALALKPSGVSVTRVVYMSGAEEDQITLIGSGSRDAVSAYKDALTSSGSYTSVSVPVGALVGSEDGGFSIVLTTII